MPTPKVSNEVGYQNTDITRFGYHISNGTSTTTLYTTANTPEQGVIDAGGQYAKRFLYEIDTHSATAGTYTIVYFVELANGDVENLTGWVVTVVDEPIVKETANVIILAGQSNMYGASPITTAMYNAYGTAGAFPNVYIHYNNINHTGDLNWKSLFSNAGFEPYYVGMGGQGTTHFGPEFGIAQYLADNRPNEKWFIVKYSAAGTYLNGQC